MSATEGGTMISRRNAFALAAVLAATAVTGGVAVTGLARGTTHPAPAPVVQPVVQPTAPQQPRATPVEEQD
jgi:hypothetical protein